MWQTLPAAVQGRGSLLLQDTARPHTSKYRDSPFHPQTLELQLCQIWSLGKVYRIEWLFFRWTRLWLSRIITLEIGSPLAINFATAWYRHWRDSPSGPPTINLYIHFFRFKERLIYLFVTAAHPRLCPASCYCSFILTALLVRSSGSPDITVLRDYGFQISRSRSPRTHVDCIHEDIWESA